MQVADLRANVDPTDLQILDTLITKATRRITDRQQSEMANSMARAAGRKPAGDRMRVQRND